MKKFIYSFVLFCGTLALILSSCKGDTGPVGPPGADGTNGVDGNEVCLTCHSLANKNLVTGMYNQSGHAAGANVAYAGGRKGCTRCHSDQGFVETQYTGADTTAFDIANPQPIQCQTCHAFHATLDFENEGIDYALRTNAPVDWIYEANSSYDFGNSSNLCATCHQTRRAPPTPGTGNFNITSTHWGPHYSGQSNLLAGKGFFEVPGTVAYPTAKYAHVDVGCNGCHMFKEDGNVTSGGHTFSPPIASCKPCHSGATNFNVNGKQTEIDDLLEDLKNEMYAVGLVDVDGRVVTGTYPVNQAGAFFNWKGIKDDGSLGVHNYPYIVALLQNSIEVF